MQNYRGVARIQFPRLKLEEIVYNTDLYAFTWEILFTYFSKLDRKYVLFPI